VLDGSAEHTGNTGVWTQMTVDEKLGSVYLPVESPQATTTAATAPVTTCTAKALVCVEPADRETQVALFSWFIIPYGTWTSRQRPFSSTLK